MASIALTFHVPEEANPGVLFSLLDTWSETPDRRYASARALIDDVRLVRDIPNRTESVAFATRLGLIERSAEGLAPTTLATALVAQRAPVRHDLLHYMAYTAWEAGGEDDNVPFWSYRGTCDALWEAAPMTVESERGRLIEHVIGASQEDFAGHPRYDPDRVSYSHKSLRAILKWLEVLTPPVLSGGVFARRSACSSELAILALGRVYREAGAVAGVDLLLTGRAREHIARLCLLDLAYVDRVLDWALARHAGFVARADHAGSYGRSVRLTAIPTVETIVEG